MAHWFVKKQSYLRLILHYHLFGFATSGNMVAFFETATANEKEEELWLNPVITSSPYVLIQKICTERRVLLVSLWGYCGMYDINKVPRHLRLALVEYDLWIFQPAQPQMAWMENPSGIDKHSIKHPWQILYGTNSLDILFVTFLNSVTPPTSWWNHC